MFFLDFFGFFLNFYFFNEYKTNFFYFKQIFYEQISHKLSFIYKKIVRYALN